MNPDQFSITRGIASTAAGFTGSVIDYALFGGTTGAGQILGGAVSSAISAVEFVALAPLILGESITSTSLVAAHSSLSMLTTIFPGSDEASFSLASFVGLVRREWNEPAESEGLPEERYGLGEVLRALAGFAALQGVTSQWQEQRWFKFMKEVPVHEGSSSFTRRKRVDSRVTITGDTIYPSHSGQIVTADITEVPVPGSWPPRQSASLLVPPSTSVSSCGPPIAPPMDDLKQTLRRLSKLVLAGYGGPSLLFFGVSLTPSQKEQRKEEAKLADAINASEKEAAGEDGHGQSQSEKANMPGAPTYSWWDVLMGKHDHDIFMHWARSQPAPSSGPTEQQPVSPSLLPVIFRIFVLNACLATSTAYCTRQLRTAHASFLASYRPCPERSCPSDSRHHELERARCRPHLRSSPLYAPFGGALVFTRAHTLPALAFEHVSASRPHIREEREKEGAAIASIKQR